MANKVAAMVKVEWTEVVESGKYLLVRIGSTDLRCSILFRIPEEIPLFFQKEFFQEKGKNPLKM